MNTIKPTGGKIIFENDDLADKKTNEEQKALALKMQMIFQDPYDYLSPWLNIRNTLGEPLRIHKLVQTAEEELEKITEILL